MTAIYDNVTDLSTPEFALLESYDKRIEDLENLIQQTKDEKQLVWYAIVHNKEWREISKIVRNHYKFLDFKGE